MGKQTVFDYARIAAEAEEKLLRIFDRDERQDKQTRSSDSWKSSGSSVVEDADVQSSSSLMAFSTLGRSHTRNYGDPVDPSAFMRTL